MAHVLLISGSLRKGSMNTAAIRTAQQLAPAGMATTICTAMASLPCFNLDDDREDAILSRKPVARINVSGAAAPTGGADGHDSLRKVLGYMQANIVEPASTRVPLTRDAVADDGTIADVAVRERIANMLSTLVEELGRLAQPRECL